MMTGRPDSNKADFGDDLLDGACLRLGLPDDGQIEASRDAAELLADPGETGAERERLGGDAGAGARRGETVERRSRRRFVVALLGLDHFGRNISGARNRNDRIVEERYSGEVGVEGGCDGDRIIAGRARLFTNAEIDDDVLDHLAYPVVGAIKYDLSHARGRLRLRQIKDAGAGYFLILPSASNCLR